MCLHLWHGSHAIEADGPRAALGVGPPGTGAPPLRRPYLRREHAGQRGGRRGSRPEAPSRGKGPAEAAHKGFALVGRPAMLARRETKRRIATMRTRTRLGATG